MKFYDREEEKQLLIDLGERSKSAAQMSFVIGRRRIGKTSLLTEVFNAPDVLYFFVSKKNESLLCEEFIETIKLKLGLQIFGTPSRFSEVFALLMETAKTRHLTVIIDEAQEFYSINASIFSDMQRIWDLNKNEARINLIMCGSVYSLMKRIFENVKEPLFGRATSRFRLTPLPVASLKEMLDDNTVSWNNENLLAFYAVTGGVPKYAELLVERKALTLGRILDVIFTSDSLFLDEGRTILIDEFGKDYGNYFSILSLIASSKTSRPDIESILGIETGGYLDRLEHDFNLVEQVRPLFAKPQSRNVKYRISDNFLKFWFRYIFRYRSAIEMKNFDYVKEIIKNDWPTYSGIILERYFTQKLAAEKNYSQIGAWWEKGNQNEIDIVAVNEMKQTTLIAEVKRNPQKISIDTLKEKSAGLLKQLGGYSVEYCGFSVKDM
jgi:AAA+ ATPase superfamily predicted ATPase